MGVSPTFSLRVALLIMLLAAALAGCSGSAPATGTPAPDDGATNNDSLFPGIPGIPLDGREPFKGASGDDGGIVPPDPGDPPLPGDPPVVSVNGADFLIMQGGFVDGTALVLGEGSEMAILGPGNNISYGLYKIPGLTGYRPVSLNIEAVPQELGDHYFIGIANYSDMHWDWFGPVNFPEFQLDLTQTGNQYVTHLGNMYFIMICPEGNTVRHERASVVLGPQDDPARPGAPHELSASDGWYPEMIELTWLPGYGADAYEIWRSDMVFMPGDPSGGGDGGDPNGGDPGDPGQMNWVMIGVTPDSFFMDFNVMPDMPYMYRVRSVNSHGLSDFSNEDMGFAAGSPPPPPPADGVVDGVVTVRLSPMGPSMPLAGVHMFMTGYPRELAVVTDEQGYFRFEGVEYGLHLVAPLDFEHAFEPPYIPVELWPSPDGMPPAVTVSFEGMPQDLHRRVWGFVHQSMFEPNGTQGGFVPMAGVEVWANFDGVLAISYGDVTDDYGYYAIDIETDGPYRMQAYLEGFNFYPYEYLFSAPLPNPDGPMPPFMFHGEPFPGGPGDPGDPGQP